ncbi:mobilization protein [Acinetobacter baumannii]|uniref:mobilization protein n=2 Tax=Acinetobacter baumannii TaxID=470 RepID=UPI001D177B83|nr:mobilization protein [Acinetobacter baumannii]
MHIKFLEHGKGSPAKASAYVLDKLDHMGNIRAGVEVLKGDATTFNAICDASPHLWKYTSGVIAWSKEDAPTDEQIKEVLDNFESHAFAGLDPSQYHLFAVLHTDQDGSKHIHVLTPRLDIQSGKSLNIAPPGHEKHFDSLRDYFNTKYQWSRPDDFLLMRTTQEPNHIVKLNKQAKKILLNQNIETLTKNQFCKAFDNYVRALLSTQTVKNRTDLIDCISALDGIDSIKPSKNFLAITLDNGKTHRLKGDFYHEQFEIESYTEHVRAAAESKPTANELAAALTDADQLRATYRAKREAYHQQHHAFTQRTADDNSARIASTLDFERDRESIPPIHQNAHNELYGANTSITSTAIEYRYIEYQNQYRFVFNIHADTTEAHQQPVEKHQDRSREPAAEYPKPSPTSTSKPKRADPERHPDLNHGKIERTEIQIHFLGDDRFWTADSFNRFISGLSNQYKSEDHRSTARSHSTEHTTNFKSNQNLESIAEISNADRNRPIFERAKRLIDSTKQLVSRAKQRIESTSEFIKKHLEQIQRSRAELTKQNHQLEYRERNPASLDPGHEIRTFKARTGQLFGTVTASISRKLKDPITSAISESIESTGFKQRCQQFSEDRIKTDSIEYQHTADRSRESTLENLASEGTRQLLQRSRDAEQANRHALGDSGKISQINQQLGGLETTVADIRLMPKPATDFHLSSLRNDNYYPDYVVYHKELCDKQQQAYDNKKLSLLIDYTKKKAENLETYMSRASRNLNKFDYDKIEQIIQNDQRMLKYRQCEKILEPQNSHFEQHRAAYKTCLKRFENIKSDIYQIKNSSPQHNVSQSDEHEYKTKPKNDLDFNF